MRKHLSAILLMAACTLSGSLGQVFLKLGAHGNMVNLQMALGIIFYSLGALLLILALKKAELSFIYPLVSLSFIWVALISKYFLDETIIPLQWSGIIIILIGTGMVVWPQKGGAKW